jgi:hypothetical protein
MIGNDAAEDAGRLGPKAQIVCDDPEPIPIL